MRKKTLFAGTAALMLAGSSFVYAQQQQGGGAAAAVPAAPAGMAGQGPNAGRPDQDGRHGWQLSPQDRAAFLDARIAALKAGLQLTPDQEKNWPAFETALRGLAKVHRDAMQARAQQAQQAQQAQPPQPPQPQDRIDRLRRRAEMLSNMAAALKQLADAEQPLLSSLNDDQKRRFALLAHMAHAHMAMLRREHAEERMHGWRPGFGGPAGWRGRDGFGGPMWMHRGSGDNTNGEGAPSLDTE